MLQARLKCPRIAFYPRIADSAGSTHWRVPHQWTPPLSLVRARHPRYASSPSKRLGDKPPETSPKKPSLAEQLFPEETRRHEEQQRASREVPRMPIDRVPIAKYNPPIHHNPPNFVLPSWLDKGSRAEETVKADGGISVLLLRNATKNLIEEDFRRLVPQGRHIEGWKVQEGDILKVIPQRDLTTLAQMDAYYILFSSTHNALLYQEHVSRIHRLACDNMATSPSSPIPPPPGYMIEGLDANAAIEAYSLVPTTQSLDMPILKKPWTPLMTSIVKNGGYKAVVDRNSKMPFEARLTMVGPQLNIPTLGYIFMETAKKRALSWSGGENIQLDIHEWEPHRNVSPVERGPAAKYVDGRDDDPQDKGPNGEDTENSVRPGRNSQLPRRTLLPVYIVGFHTEHAAKTFVTYWHNRPLVSDRTAMQWEIEEELPPVANVEFLW